ncbi:hypothetical protein TcasGA2_TC032524 [Tribolium castaneum]|uniref:Uncharacterized protein n=1 Tax=Tribolium castaneum TaxID=7070 RepID=A0A139WKM1_TRICA|nr:hypothetical protein TcasGA2_TC032524 [Tribolium castaneum]
MGFFDQHNALKQEIRITPNMETLEIQNLQQSFLLENLRINLCFVHRLDYSKLCLSNGNSLYRRH